MIGLGISNRRSYVLLAASMLAVVAQAYVPEPRPAKSAIEITALYYPGTEHMPEWDVVAETCPERRPLLGWFDEGNPEAIDWQIKWAVEHGISSFCVDWYWNNGRRRLEHWVKGYYKARFRRYLKWYMMYANHNQPGSHSTADQIAVTRYWIDNYFRTPEYYAIDGKPVVCIWAPDNIDADFIAEAAAKGEKLAKGEGIRRAFAISERMVREAGLSGIHWQLMWFATRYDEAAARAFRAQGFRTAISYGLVWGVPDLAPEAMRPGDTKNAFSFDVVKAAAPKVWREMSVQKVLPDWVAIPTGWDDRPRSFAAGSNVIRDRTPAAFAEVCRAARAFCETNGLGHVIIHPINEWQEGSYIEPNEEHGFGMYEALRDAFCERPPEGWPKTVVPQDVGLGPYDFPPMYRSPVQGWAFDGTTEGWYRQPYGGGEVECHDGCLTFVVNRLGNFNIRQRLVPFAADRYRTFRVRMRIVPNARTNDNRPKRLRLKWGTKEVPIIGLGLVVDQASCLASCPVRCDGQWHEYALDLAGNQDWSGEINELWFEAADLMHARVAIDWMRFEERGTAVVASPDRMIVRNGGFEETKDGKTVAWSRGGNRYAFVDGMGRNGTRALAYENDDPTFYAIPSQSIQLEPGKTYRFEVWVRTENLTGPKAGATICLEWHDANGKWIGGDYAAGGVKGTTPEWERIECATTIIPPNAKTCSISPFVHKGMRGKAWFDDVAVTPYCRKPVDGLFCSAYRDVADEGTVTFKARLNLDAAECPLDRLKATMSWTDAAGKVRTAPVDSLTTGEAAWSHGVKDMKSGTQTIKFRLMRKDGRAIGSAERTFTRVGVQPRRSVRFDRFGRTIVNGRPFFPLGMYWMNVKDGNELETYVQGPFNCLMPYVAPDKDGLDRCQAKGLKVIYSLASIYCGTQWVPPEVKTEADEIAYVKGRVAKYKDHPAVLAWYLNDELSVSMLARLTVRRDLMERLDPDHPCWAVLYQYSQIRDYLSTFDVIGTDPYPIPSSPASMATRWTRATRNGTMGLKPLWQVPQAFDWAGYREKPEEKAKCRAPTPAELRSMTWQCIAAGANGLIYYSYFDLRKEPNGVPFARRWKEVCDVAEEVKSLFPVLLADGPAPTVMGVPDTLGVRTWGVGDAACLLAVNTTDKPITATLKLSERFVSAKPIFGPASDLVGSGLSISLAPLEPVLLRLAK